VDPLALLARLAGQEVERARRTLAALDAQLDARRQEMAREQTEIARESSAATGLDAARQLATWLVARRQRRRLAERELERLEAARATQLARLGEQRLELKRLERLQARRQERQRAQAHRREQRAADELALLQAARRGADRAG
jgi:flagellar export protein FliJ